MRALLVDNEPRRSEVQEIRRIFTECGFECGDYDFAVPPKDNVRCLVNSLREATVAADVCVVDYRLSWEYGSDNWDGDRIAAFLREKWPYTYILYVSAYLQTLGDAYSKLVDILSIPFTGYLELKPGWEDHFRAQLRCVRALVRDERISAISDFGPDLVQEFFTAAAHGSSPAFLECVRTASRVSGSDATILILGESGTGKELMARAVHAKSGRSERPFVPINCGAIPATLIESELFGYEKGAFTGATTRTPGKVHAADGGTLFLDEIGDMPIELQPKLLRFLQDGSFYRVGSNREERVDARVITATNQDLKELIGSGRFRMELYYRLSVIPIRVPSLRDRGQDIQDLARVFLEKECAAAGRRTIQLSGSALDALAGHSWPGNVRELENAIKRGVLLCEGNAIEAEDLRLEEVDGARAAKTPELRLFGSDFTTAAEEFEREYIRRLMKNAKSIAAAARMYGCRRETLSRKITDLGLRGELGSCA